MNQYEEISSETILKDKRKRKVNNRKPTEKLDNLSVKHVEPLTEAQRQFFFSFKEGYHIVAAGAAGTGKTFISTYLALDQLFKREVEQIIFVRSIVASRDLGFLPGDIWEKSEPYWSLYKDHVNELCENGTAWDILFKKGLIQFETTSFLRGKTWNNAIIILDEAQNLARSEIYTVLTRIGQGSTVIICGDHKQTDLKKNETGWGYLNQLIDKTDDLFDTVNFTFSDIVRSDFVKQIIIADSEIA